MYSPTTHRPHLRFHGVGGHLLQLAVIFGILHGKVNSAWYIAQVVNSVLLPFLRQEGDVLIQHGNVRPHMAPATHGDVLSVQQLTWPARSPDLLPIEHVLDMVKRNLLFLQSLPQPLPNCDNEWKMLGTVYRRITFGS